MDPRFWTFDAEPEEGHPQPFGSETFAIVDDVEGGVIAYVHSHTTPMIVTALNTMWA